jgi:hypothetical protein
LRPFNAFSHKTAVFTPLSNKGVLFLWESRPVAAAPALLMPKRTRREPRPPMTLNVLIVEEAEERAILDVMRPWPRLMEARLKAAGYENFADGDAMLQDMFERKLADPREKDALASVAWLAERGHRSAQEALCNFAEPMLEDGAANLPTSIRRYLIEHMRGRVPTHPQDHQNDILRNLLRDIGMATMAAVAVGRWRLPELNSGRRHSAAWFVAAVMTEYGHALSERQVRRIIQTYGRGFGKRLSDFLLAGAVK